ncbi:hypothetical protein [Legionella fairfieldensis]|uniref:hypothetical protein n=1 Tax=Legionella fairfieldensis TaxID=45064 RepID=UPI0006889323|nr:hypothetical protein [Legionella fairfieldensis]
MKRTGLRELFVCFTLLLGANYVNATDSAELAKTELEPTENTASFHALQAYWVFSGIVANESGEHYSYYFQMQRKDQELQAIATLIDSQTREVLLFEEASTILDHPEATNWRAERIFMQFNPINNSWVFGVKAKNDKGFNFKVDMLREAISTPAIQDLRSGVELLVNQTGRLNGHLQIGEANKEQFVTASKAWFKQVWVSKPQEALHPLTGILCQFNDGSAFYAVNMQEPDALRGAVAGWRDTQGMPISMSQFVSVNEAEESMWYIHIPSPKVRLSLRDALAKETEKHHLIAGLTEGLPGFCVISKDEIAQQLPGSIHKTMG